MDTHAPELFKRPTQFARMHPLAVAAAIAIILFCGVGIASMMGLIPSAFSQKKDYDPTSMAQLPQPPATSMAQSAPPAAQTVPPAVAPAAVEAAPGAQMTPGPVAACGTCGRVESIHTVEVKGKGSGLGAVAGGVTGAVVGDQFGNGRGSTVMALLGAAGGAFAGNEIEKNVKKHAVYRVTVRMDDGTYRTLSESHLPQVGVGERVRISHGTVIADRN